MVADMIRINKVANGFVISSRKGGRVPQAYSYTDRAVARTTDEVCKIIRGLLTEHAYPDQTTKGL